MAGSPSFWQGRRVFVTGCTGLLGKAAVGELLERKAVVVGLVRDRVADASVRRDPLFRSVQLIHGLVEDRFRVQSALSVHDVQTVLHLAGPTEGADPGRGTSAVLTAARDYSPETVVVAARPIPPLGLALAAKDEPPLPSLPWGVAQFGEVFGGGDRKTFRIIPATLIAHVTGDRRQAPSDGPARDFVHAPDAARACLALAEALAAKPQVRPLVVPFRSGWVFSDREIGAYLRAVLADAPLPALPAPPGQDRPYGWKPQQTLAEALRVTADWYREFLQTWFFGTRTADAAYRKVA